MRSRYIFILSLMLFLIVHLQMGFAQDTLQRYVPEGATARLGKGKANGIAYSPDGTQLVIASSIGIWGYDMDTREELPLLTKYTGFVPSATYSPDGRVLTSANEDGTVRLWNPDTGELIAILPGHTDWVTSVAYLPEGGTIVSGGRDNTVRLWDATTGQLSATLTRHTGWVTSVACSPDGKQIASGSEDSTVRLWDATTGELSATLTRHTGKVTSVAYSPDGSTIASGSADGTVRLWEATTGQPILIPIENMGEVTSVVYSPDGSTIASGSADGTVRLWEATTGQLDATLTRHTGWVTSVVYSPAGATLASSSADGSVILWDAATRQPIVTLTGYIDWVTSVVYSPDGTTLASGSQDGALRLWDTGTEQASTMDIGHPNSVVSIAYSPDSSMIVSAGGYGDNTVRLWDINMDRSLDVLIGHTSSVYAVAYSPDGSTIASCGGFGDSTVRLWDTATRQLKATLAGHTRRINTIAYSRDGGTLISGGRDNTVRLWDTATERLKFTLTEHEDRVYAVAYSPGGSTIASGSRDDTVRLWDATTGQLKFTLIGHTYGVRSVAYSPDGTTLASGGEDGTVRLWDATTGHAITTLTGHTGWVTSVAYSPDGTTLASGSADGTIILWDYTSLRTQEQRLQQAVSELPQDDALPKVQILYFRPIDRLPQQDIETQVDRVIKDVQLFYARQMRNYGFGIKTFRFETDMTGKTVVHRVEGRFTEAHYREQPYGKILEEIDAQFDRSRNVLLLFLEVGDEVLGSNVCGLGGVHRDGGGTAMLPAAGECFSFRIVAHELGHAFGLYHDFREPNLMSGSSGYREELSECAAQALRVNPFFNTFQDNKGPTTIQQHPLLVSQLNTINYNFEVNDMDSLHQAQLFTTSTQQDPIQGLKLLGCKQLSGERATVEFIVPKSIAIPGTPIGLRVIDGYGNVTQQWHKNEPDTSRHLDVNSDGVVNIFDLVLVVSEIGQTGTSNRADINGDGVVNIQDLVLVADGIGKDTAAAPLEHLLATLIPKETILFPNYPNPFNPETWIPYQLANDSDVSITIYDARGGVVRRLDLGHQRAGYYTHRSRAAYWDGRNGSGEHVATGIYFYQLQADNMSFLRKMLILK